MILSSDAEYLTLTFHVEALEDPGIFGMQGPCLQHTGGWREEVLCMFGF